MGVLHRMGRTLWRMNQPENESGWGYSNFGIRFFLSPVPLLFSSLSFWHPLTLFICSIFILMFFACGAQSPRGGVTTVLGAGHLWCFWQERGGSLI